ncbi:MAG: RT0821/Lpp0805 family surface protein [Siculibacillus sp.]
MLGIAPMLGGCAGIMMPLSSWMSGPEEASTEITGSIPKVPATAASTDGDGETVRRAIEAASATGREAPLAWKNETTGNSGTITHVTGTRAANGAPCRDFETTLVKVSGVDLHGGRVCQGFSGAWELVRFDRVGG